MLIQSLVPGLIPAQLVSAIPRDAWVATHDGMAGQRLELENSTKRRNAGARESIRGAQHTTPSVCNARFDAGAMNDGEAEVARPLRDEIPVGMMMCENGWSGIQSGSNGPLSH